MNKRMTYLSVAAVYILGVHRKYRNLFRAVRLTSWQPTLTKCLKPSTCSAAARRFEKSIFCSIA
jgi:hypothetical protein